MRHHSGEGVNRSCIQDLKDQGRRQCPLCQSPCCSASLEDGGSASRNLMCPRGSVLLGLQNSQQRPRAIPGVGDLVATLLSRPLPPTQAPTHSSCAFIQVLLSECLTRSAAPPPSSCFTTRAFQSHLRPWIQAQSCLWAEPLWGLSFSFQQNSQRTQQPAHSIPKFAPLFLFTILEDSSDNTTAVRVLSLDAPIS